MSTWAERLRVTRTDAILAAVLTVAGLVQTQFFPVAQPGVAELSIVGSTLPLAWRRRFPIEAAAVSSAFWLIPLAGYPVLGFVAVLLQYYAVGLYGAPRAAVWLVTTWGCLTGVLGTFLGPEQPVAAIGGVLVVVAPVVAGQIVAHQRRQTQALLRLAAELEEEKRKVLEAAVSGERARIAQELHDVLGHELTLIAVQAEAASAALRLAPDRAAVPVEAIRETAHRTLRSIRSTLDVVAPPSDPTDATPAGLTDLARRARDAGIATELELTGTPWPGQTPIWLAVHRIVRECLTNAGRHAPGRPVSVCVHWAPDSVTVTSANATDARGQPAASRGLSGMRHRAEFLGGTFAAAVADGIFRVRVTLPAVVAGGGS
ncbi:sensor histidine kinase [Actinoplanes sp. CA-030573]|uniref:sensor histidine kinase n=1 Tax=Actinoplanes sp. CA-030573 TaxID=3239898 RepID=UPI003D914A23